MSNPEVAERRLVVVRDLPLLTEMAFRAAAREVVLIRPLRQRVEAVMNERVRFHFSRLVRSGSTGGSSLKEARHEMEQCVERFTTSVLFRRLMALLPARLHLAEDERFDLIVLDGNQKQVAVRFGAEDPTRLWQRSNQFAALDLSISTIVTYDSKSGADETSRSRAVLRPSGSATNRSPCRVAINSGCGSVTPAAFPECGTSRSAAA